MSISDNAQNCSGMNFGTNVQETINFWDENNCLNIYSAFINSSTGGILEYTEEQLIIAQGYVNALFTQYLGQYELTDNVTNQSFNPFQYSLLDLCISPGLPGLCGTFLESYCSGYTRQDAIESNTLTQFCGCWVPADPNYINYTFGNFNCTIGATGCSSCSKGTTGCYPQPSCDPLCALSSTSQKSNITSGNLITCARDICVIQKQNINIENSRIGGGINFNTLCAGCTGAQGCLCILAGNDINTVASSVGLGVNFHQICGSNSTCITENNEGTVLSVDNCQNLNPNNIPVSSNVKLNYGILFILFVILVIGIILVIIYKLSNKKDESKN